MLILNKSPFCHQNGLAKLLNRVVQHYVKARIQLFPVETLGNKVKPSCFLFYVRDFIFFFVTQPTCLSCGCSLSALEDREGCRLRSSELHRDVSGDRRWQSSLERPRSRCSDRETGRH